MLATESNDGFAPSTGIDTEGLPFGGGFGGGAEPPIETHLQESHSLFVECKVPSVPQVVGPALVKAYFVQKVSRVPNWAASVGDMVPVQTSLYTFVGLILVV